LRVPGNKALTLARNSNFGTLKISKISAGTPVQPFPGEPTYVIPIQISAQGAALGATVTVPFYFKSNAAGQIQDCYATVYTDLVGTTLEDNICRQTDPATTFSAANQFCALPTAGARAGGP
jgi:hypothetical protein